MHIAHQRTSPGVFLVRAKHLGALEIINSNFKKSGWCLLISITRFELLISLESNSEFKIVRKTSTCPTHHLSMISQVLKRSTDLSTITKMQEQVLMHLIAYNRIQFLSNHTIPDQFLTKYQANNFKLTAVD
jgi:hypothetical protein